MKMKFHIDVVFDLTEQGEQELKKSMKNKNANMTKLKEQAERVVLDGLQDLFKEDKLMNNLDIKVKCVVKHN
jgi:hypothetical protein